MPERTTAKAEMAAPLPASTRKCGVVSGPKRWERAAARKTTSPIQARRRAQWAEWE
ncbi:hypothetical protein D9M72_597580 [compost metagenome]